VRAERDPIAWQQSLDGLEQAARTDQNVMPTLIEAVKAYATLGEITNCLRGVYGEYRQLLVV
jgi:methylmalonyl-CoA mutase N-terminal domain/subunit